MVVFQICKYFIPAVQNIVGVQITVLLLGCADNVNGSVRCLFKLRIRVLGEGISHRLDPFIKITVLKYKSVKFIFQMLRVLGKRLKTAEGVGRLLIRIPHLFSFQILLSGCFKISHAVAGCRPLHPVIQGIPLIRKHLGPHQLHLFFPKIIGYLYTSKGKRSAEILSVHVIHPPSVSVFESRHGSAAPE